MRLYCGAIVHSTNEKPLEILPDSIVGVDGTKIAFIEPYVRLEEIREKYDVTSIQRLSNSQFLMPGLVDCHLHAPQYPNVGLGLDLPLLEWLNKYTYPLESKLSDVTLARKTYKHVVKTTLSCGTTTAAYFGTNSVEGTLELCNAIAKQGQRAIVGKVCTDINVPDNMVETTEQSLEGTARFIKLVKEKGNSRITPSVTPRFALSCTPELLSGLGKLAKEHNVPIQSHLAECKEETAQVESMHKLNSYAKVYDSHGLFTNKAIMAHCVYLTDDELDLMKERGVGIAHCPNSNLSIRSGMLDVRRVLKRGIKIGLGTDISGGYSTSILNAIRYALLTANAIAIQSNISKNILLHDDVFRMATLGGAQVLGMERITGNFEVGKSFDALIVDGNAKRSSYEIFEENTIDERIQKFLYLGDDRNIVEIYVAGHRLVYKL